MPVDAAAIQPATPTDACVRAIAVVEPGSGIPANLLGAISRVESGRHDARDGRVKAWPWTVNAEGRGALYATKAEAMAAVVTLRSHGVQSIDVGCMQVNLMHHPAAFVTLDDAFDPLDNVRYAAVFLRALHAETRDWTLAAAFYHSRTPERMLPYQKKVLAQLPGASSIHPAPTVSDPLRVAWAATIRVTVPASLGFGPGWTGLVRGAGPRLRTSAGRRLASYVSR